MEKTEKTSAAWTFLLFTDTALIILTICLFFQFSFPFHSPSPVLSRKSHDELTSLYKTSSPGSLLKAERFATKS